MSDRQRPALLIGRAEVARLLTLAECMAAIEAAFASEAAGGILGPAVLGINAPGGGLHVKAAGLVGPHSYFAAKVNANFPGNPQTNGLPAIQGAVVLCDAVDGRLLAIIDSAEVTALRTAATSAVAAKYLARSDSRVLTICGCGTQGRRHLEAIAPLFGLTTVLAFDARAEAAERLAGDSSALNVQPTRDLAAAVRRSDICVTCTPSRRPLIGPADVSPGLFLAAVGADNPDKQELDPRVLAGATVVADLVAQGVEMGELHHAVATGVMRPEDVHAELGEVVTGRKRGRRSAKEIIIFDSTGTALQDVAAAAHVYERAVAAGAGQPFVLG